MRGAEDKLCWAFLSLSKSEGWRESWLSLWVEVDKNRDKPRIYFPSLRLAFHPAKALRE